MRVGVLIEETWDFFKEIHDDLKKNFQTSVFKRRELPLPFFRERVNRHLFHSDLRAFIRANDVLFFEWASGLLAEATHMEKTRGIVTRLHRYELYQWADRINWDGVDKVILVSRAKQEEFNKRFPDHAQKSVVVCPSTSLERFVPVPKRFEGNIGTLCHLTPRKRVYDLILDFYDLARKKNGIHLHIAGGKNSGYADYYEALHYLVGKLGLRDKVTFYDHIVQTWDWYRRMDIFISNSYSEGLQVALMEAMASGCFCLSHFWDGADELLPGENLFFSSAELQEKVLGYCDLKESEKQRARENMRAIAVERFDIGKTICQIRAIVEEVGFASISKSGAR